jgi:hypothetical protein
MENLAQIAPKTANRVHHLHLHLDVEMGILIQEKNV